jgi:hypothetical protein
MTNITTMIINNKIDYDYIETEYKKCDNKYHYISTIINTILTSICNHKSYKFNNFYKLYEFIVNTLFIKYKITEFDNNILIGLTMLNNGTFLLKKIYYIMDDTSTINIESLLSIACRKGIFSSFIFWLKLLKSIDIKLCKDLFIDSIINTDDRIYKFLLNKIIKLNYEDNIEIFIKKIIVYLDTSQIPIKYKLKRIKFISENISLTPYINILITYFNNTEILKVIHKYYYKTKYTYRLLNILIIRNINIYDSLLTNEEKILYNIIYSINNNKLLVLDLNNNNKNIILNNCLNILNSLIEYENIFLIYNNINILFSVLNNTIITNIIETNYLYKSLCNNNNMLLFTKYLKLNYKYDNHIKINLCLHKLRLCLKYRYNCKLINHKIKYNKILNEIKTYKPNKNTIILSKGSLNYQYNKQQYTNIHPRHLLPFELLLYNNFLLREKADGILIHNLPTSITPYHISLYNYEIKAEYIEDLDLYLVFDIDIPNTSIIERYNILRNMHIFTNNLQDLDIIHNLNDFYKIIQHERLNLKQFLKENTLYPKWYPKMACHIIVNNNDIFTDIINDIILEEKNMLNELELYKCDGLILSPIDGRREIKIKPKSLLTIDLLYNNNKWYDKNNNIYDNIKLIEDFDYINNRIYRCYPYNDIFIAKEIRIDKKIPNNYSIIDNIYKILEYKWDDELNINKYYYTNKHNNTLNNKIKKELDNQPNILIQHLNILNPDIHKYWLDLGCGKGKLIKHIKKYIPYYYKGLDIDVKQLNIALKYYDENEIIYNFNVCDLNLLWKDNKISWWSLDNKIKYDYIIANFSIMHFFCDNFWNQLNYIINIGTKFMFNIVSNFSDDNIWECNNSYLKIINNQVIYKFEWISDEIKIEQFINEDIIKKYIKKFNWNIIYNNKIEYNKLELHNIYSWWIIEKI